jgi:hypothetical protein
VDVGGDNDVDIVVIVGATPVRSVGSPNPDAISPIRGRVPAVASGKARSGILELEPGPLAGVASGVRLRSTNALREGTRDIDIGFGSAATGFPRIGIGVVCDCESCIADPGPSALFDISPALKLLIGGKTVWARPGLSSGVTTVELR